MDRIVDSDDPLGVVERPADDLKLGAEGSFEAINVLDRKSVV